MLKFLFPLHISIGCSLKFPAILLVEELISPNPLLHYIYEQNSVNFCTDDGTLHTTKTSMQYLVNPLVLKTLLYLQKAKMFEGKVIGQYN